MRFFYSVLTCAAACVQECLVAMLHAQELQAHPWEAQSQVSARRVQGAAHAPQTCALPPAHSWPSAPATLLATLHTRLHLRPQVSLAMHQRPAHIS